MNTLFNSRKLSSKGVEDVAVVENLFSKLLDSLLVLCPEGRELSIVKTKLEEASMYAKKAISLRKEATGFIVEYESYLGWERSINTLRTVPVPESLYTYVFSTYEAALAEATAQQSLTDMNYRVAEIKTDYTGGAQ
jgi:hypothetical protein